MWWYDYFINLFILCSRNCKNPDKIRDALVIKSGGDVNCQQMDNMITKEIALSDVKFVNGSNGENANEKYKFLISLIQSLLDFSIVSEIDDLCNNVKCHKLIKKTTNVKKHCTLCHYRWCGKCGEDHGNQTCAEYKMTQDTTLDEDVRTLITQGIVRICPMDGCNWGCTRNEEAARTCHHMVCKKCNTEFCWICGKNITHEGYEHFGESKGLCRLFPQ